MPSRFSLWVAQNWSSTLGPGWSPRSSTMPESFFRIFHICPDHWTIKVSIEYNKPRSSGQPVGLRETDTDTERQSVWAEMAKCMDCRIWMESANRWKQDRHTLIKATKETYKSELCIHEVNNWASHRATPLVKLCQSLQMISWQHLTYRCFEDLWYSCSLYFS